MNTDNVSSMEPNASGSASVANAASVSASASAVENVKYPDWYKKGLRLFASSILIAVSILSSIRAISILPTLGGGPFYVLNMALVCNFVVVMTIVFIALQYECFLALKNKTVRGYEDQDYYMAPFAMFGLLYVAITFVAGVVLLVEDKDVSVEQRKATWFIMEASAGVCLYMVILVFRRQILEAAKTLFNCSKVPFISMRMLIAFPLEIKVEEMISKKIS